ncbi:MAG: hypothetical protein EZS28_001838 [Streblomastix strix]|uniref:Uncharacterized protein n=1 Tax=Streblomastix strix TaxID=222440 RepID=A0A5J4X7Z2_9EUKA|nr:MAG: hypothetical protein EZS28_001838 [Streblomastix strix]
MMYCQLPKLIRQEALLLLKADKSELIDSCCKTEDEALLLLKADKTQLVNSYLKTETDTKLDLKVDKAQLIDLYSKTEDDALLALKADMTQLIDSYTKTEDDTHILLKANAADVCNKEETFDKVENEKKDAVTQIADKANIIRSNFCYNYIKTYQKNDASILLADGGDMLVSSLVNQTQLQEVRNIATGKSKTYVFDIYGQLNDWMAVQENVANLVIEDDLYIVDKEITDYWWDGTDLKVLETELLDMNNFIATLGVTTGSGNAIIDLSIDTETNNLLNDKANKSTTYRKTETDNLIAQIDVGDTITSNKTFNNVCRFVSSIDGMPTVTISSFIKADADDRVVLLRASGTKSLSEFIGTPTELSNYYTKTQTQSQTEYNNRFWRNNSNNMVMQQIKGRLTNICPIVGSFDETQYRQPNKYPTNSEVDAKLKNVVTTETTQSIAESKIFTSYITVSGFEKTVKEDTPFLLAGSGDILLSAFGGLELVNITYTTNVVSPTSIMSLKCYRYGSLVNFYAKIYLDSGAGASSASVAVCVLARAGFPKYLFYSDDTVLVGSSPHFANFKFGTDGKVMISFQTLIGIAGLADETLLDAARLSEFPEYYAYISETVQEPVPSAFFLASSGSDPQLIVYGDRVTLTASYETTGLFPNGYLFKSYPEFARPKAGDKVIALVDADVIKQKCTSQIPSKTALVINVTYYKKYESSKKINYDANNDGIVNIMDTWHVNGKAVQVAVSGVLNKYDCEFYKTYRLDNYQNPTSNEQNALQSDPLVPDSNIGEVIIKHV